MLLSNRFPSSIILGVLLTSRWLCTPLAGRNFASALIKTGYWIPSQNRVIMEIGSFMHLKTLKVHYHVLEVLVLPFMLTGGATRAATLKRLLLCVYSWITLSKWQVMPKSYLIMLFLPSMTRFGTHFSHICVSALSSCWAASKCAIKLKLKPLLDGVDSCKSKCQVLHITIKGS